MPWHMFKFKTAIYLDHQLRNSSFSKKIFITDRRDDNYNYKKAFFTLIFFNDTGIYGSVFKGGQLCRRKMPKTNPWIETKI